MWRPPFHQFLDPPLTTTPQSRDPDTVAVGARGLLRDQYYAALTSAEDDAVDTVIVRTDRLRHGHADDGPSPTAMKYGTDG